MFQESRKLRVSRVLLFLVALLVATVAMLLFVAPMRTLALNNLLTNGDFASDTAGWDIWGGTPSVSDGVLEMTVDPNTSDYWDAGIQQDIGLEEGTEYTIILRARANQAVTIPLIIQQNGTYTPYFQQIVPLSTTMQTYLYTFESSATDSDVLFDLYLGDRGAFTAWVDYVVLESTANLLQNGDFADGDIGWNVWFTENGMYTVTNGVLEINVPSGLSNYWDGAMDQVVSLEKDAGYLVSLEARADRPVTLPVQLKEDGGDWDIYFSQEMALTTITQTYYYPLVSDYADDAALFATYLGGTGAFTTWVDSIVLEPWVNALTNSDFDSGTDPWFRWGDVTASVSGGTAVITNTPTGSGGAFEQGGVAVSEGARYTFLLNARADTPVTVSLSAQLNTNPYTEYFRCEVPLTTEMQTHVCEGVVSDVTDESAAFVFVMPNEAFTMWVDSVYMGTTGLPEAPEPPPTPQAARVNQVGYLPLADKHATIATTTTTPLEWQLLNDSGVAVTGTTSVFGDDPASGDHVHIADFSNVSTSGVYTLQVGTHTSYPFEIGEDIYAEMKYDALDYFYHARSGIAITMPYAGDSQWTRPAGHVSPADSASGNKGDFDVPCFAGTAGGLTWRGTCTTTTGSPYSLTVTGGWYDAGDYGKYVVPGGFATWMLQNLYERAQATGDEASFADDTMNIPESGNGVPDLLDEARWEVEFLLSMQVPDGAWVERYNPGLDTTEFTDTLGGMVHHKVHGNAYGGYGELAHEDAAARHLYPPSTAATLHLAAVGAQTARLWESFDSDFATECLDAAERAWQAALAHDAEYFPSSLTQGGGAYDDTRVSDEFYWAAAELYVTTGEQTYEDYLLQSTHALTVPQHFANEGSVSMIWPNTEAFGTLSLLIAPNTLSETLLLDAQDNLVATADYYLDVLANEGHRVPFTSTTGYPWGSNYYAINNAVILGVAHDLTGNRDYFNGAAEGIDYILGRNGLAKSYVSGYGEDPLQNPHHMFWAHQYNDAYPPPPPGVLSGGPNSGLQDPKASAELTGCPPQKCFIDHIESWSTNEITIYWNASLAWLTAYLDAEGQVETLYLPLIMRSSSP